MKIAIFTDSFLPGVGGTEQAIFAMGKNLSSQHVVLVCAPKYRGDNSVAGGGFSIARCKSIKLSVNDNIPLPRFSKKFKKELNEFAPDIVHCQSASGMAGFGIRYAKKHNIPIVFTLHTRFHLAYYNSSKSKIFTMVMIRNLAKKLNKADLVTVVSKVMAEDIKNYGYKGQALVLKNGYQSVFNLKPKEKDIKKLHFLFVGHIGTLKRVDFLLRALKHYKTMPKARSFDLKLVGLCSEREYFTKLVEKLGLSEEVIFYGVIKNREKLAEIYQNATLFLFPSIFDNDPLTVIEAGQCATPCLVIENTGASERIIDGVNGYICKDNEEAFAEKIHQIFSDIDCYKKVCSNSRKLAQPWHEVCKEYCKIYTSLTKK